MAYQLTLLDMTQAILRDIGDDSVNSINDTPASQQVAGIIKDSYYSLVTERDWTFLNQETNLVGLGDTSNPTKMDLPASCNKVYWVKYNKKDVHYLYPKDFRDMLDSRTETVDLVDANGFGLNADPSYWTSFDDTSIVFDSRDQDVDTTLQQSKSRAYIQRMPAFTLTDTFVPEMPDKFFPTLLAESKAAASVVLNQQVNAREEQRARRGRVRMQKDGVAFESLIHKSNSAIDYGRKR